MNEEVKKALDDIVADLLAMPNEKFRDLIQKEEESMKKAVLEGTEHIGLSLWYGTDPKGCQEYIDKVLAEAQNKT